MSSNNKLAIFDFCDTLFDGQSIAYFTDFLALSLPFQNRVIYEARKRLNRIPSTDSKRFKENSLKAFRGMEEEKVNQSSREFFEAAIQKKLHKQVLERLQAHKLAGDIIVLASGGFENYLKFFKEYFGADHMFCTKLQFKNSKFTGLIEGKECLGIEKSARVKNFFLEFDIDWKNSFVYSDHRSDLPLFELAGNKIVVQNRQQLDWISGKEGFKVLKINNGN